MARGLTSAERTVLLLQVREVYARLAQRPIDRNCLNRTECCRFRLTGRTPFLTRGEALVAHSAARAAGKKKLPLPADGSCPLLGPDGRCTIYDSRPFACRTHFCEAAGGPYSRKEVRDLIHELEAIDQRLGGSGGMGLPAAMKWATEQSS
jgi:Fe-S-cluster containining protein